jgi:cell wall-associated NlpC family hydrolase/L,D-peptidoglycan transpeptidase YkuD (ErfK/YbiS/YcfS/YnhG family)
VVVARHLIRLAIPALAALAASIAAAAPATATAPVNATATGIAPVTATATATATTLKIPADADQLIVVSSPTADPPAPGYLATLRVYQRANSTAPWRRVFGPWAAETGSGHLLPATDRREGDHATPIGVFGIGSTMYGNEPNPGGLHYAYHRLVCGDWWDEDPYSARYNEFAHVPCGVTPGFAAWSEPLWTETVAYPYFAVTQFNMNPIRRGSAAPGSGIFLHSWVGGATEGCVALPQSRLLQILRWLRRSAHPVIEIGTDREIEAAARSATAATSATATTLSTRYVDVSVATVWSSPSAPGPGDRPLLGNPVNEAAWSRGQDTAARLALVGRIQTQALFGEPVRVLAQRGSWTRIAVVDQPTPLNRLGYPGWVPTVQLAAGPTFGPRLTGPIAVVDRPTATLRDGVRPIELSFGTRLPELGSAGDDLLVATPTGQTARVARSSVAVYASPTAIPVPTGPQLVSTARRFLGVRYLWGGTSAFSFDCSGFVNLVYRVHGITIPRDADAQAVAGRTVARSALEPGDLVFFATDPPSRAVTHVAMYVGAGNVIEAPDSAGSVHILPLAAFGDEYVTARRYLPTTGT